VTRGARRAIRRAAAPFAAALGCLALFCASALAAESNVGLERRVKAAFLYQFIPYVEWPARAHRDAESPIVIAVAGPEASVAEIEAVIDKRTVGGRPVVVRRWRDGDAQGGAHIVYVTRAESQRLGAIARAAQAAGTLVVSEQEGALDAGSMINFRLVDGRVRFDIALGAAERAGLRVSARLLSVAQSVRPS
jgi:hypothetical protein